MIENGSKFAVQKLTSNSANGNISVVREKREHSQLSKEFILKSFTAMNFKKNRSVPVSSN